MNYMASIMATSDADFALLVSGAFFVLFALASLAQIVVDLLRSR